MRRASPLILLVCVSALVIPSVASESPAAVMMRDALVVVHANDLLWCDRQILTYAAAANRDPQVQRRLLAGILLRSRSLNGVDLSRPAVIAWRDHAAPMLAIIPIDDRRAFLEEFGADTQFGAPLVRVAEREGTTVYWQQSGDAMAEYRLLVQDDTAYLASSLDECRQLADLPLGRIGDGPPLQVRLRGPALARLALPTLNDLPLMLRQPRLGATMVSLLARYGGSTLPSIADQVDRVDLEVRADGDGALVIDGRLLARSNAPLAQFLAVQKNQSSRLLPLVESPATAFASYGSIAWQGQLDRLGQDVAQQVGPALGAAWNAQAEDSWRRSWAIRDRNGAFVSVTEVRRDEDGILDVAHATLTEQNQAGDLVVHAQRFAMAERTVFAERVWSGRRIADQVIEDCSISGLPGWRHALTIDGVAVDAVQIATGRHVLGIESFQGRAVTIAEEWVPRVLLDGGQRPAGAAALIAGWIDPAVVARALTGDALKSLPPARIAFSAKASPQGDLLLRLDLPYLALAIVEREARTLLARPAARR